MEQIAFSDKVVTYDKFVADVAERVAAVLIERQSLPPYISQRRAFQIYGQGNVRRWRSEGKIEPCVRPGKVEYKVSRLNELQRDTQDYM